MYLEHRLSALLQLHLHSRPNTWLQWAGQKATASRDDNGLSFSIWCVWYRRSYGTSLHCIHPGRLCWPGTVLLNIKYLCHLWAEWMDSLRSCRADPLANNALPGLVRSNCTTKHIILMWSTACFLETEIVRKSLHAKNIDDVNITVCVWCNSIGNILYISWHDNEEALSEFLAIVCGIHNSPVDCHNYGPMIQTVDDYFFVLPHSYMCIFSDFFYAFPN